MTINKLTPGSNLRWEASRMILPEHRELLIKDRQELKKQTRPELTEEEQQEMFGRLQASKSNTLEVTVTVFGEYENRQIVGVVTGLDPSQRLVKVDVGNDWQLIDFTDVIGVDLDAVRY